MSKSFYKHTSTRILQLDLSGNKIREFEAISLAIIHIKSIHKIKNQASAESAISNCCSGRQKSAFGFKWQYA